MALAVAGCSSTPASDKFSVGLTADDVPAGDPDASGRLTVELETDPLQACYDISVQGLLAPSSGEIRSEDGKVVLKLFKGSRLDAAVSGSGKGGQTYAGKGCSKVGDPDKVEQILEDPDGYVVTVSNDEHPQGALGGPLGK